MTDAYLKRLRKGGIETMETSPHLIAAAAYPVLERRGELLKGRISRTSGEPEKLAGAQSAQGRHGGSSNLVSQKWNGCWQSARRERLRIAAEARTANPFTVARLVNFLTTTHAGDACFWTGREIK
ncbi:hypothetical protein, partial [Rhizobium wenxiniae]|uniref:hypothetical protein n=1 Tax=Rhizobium wenxiniae TaxID=1737357 RepID=UPI003C1698D2